VHPLTNRGANYFVKVFAVQVTLEISSVLYPMNRGRLGARALNLDLQAALYGDLGFVETVNTSS
jgi:hypothetical protein